MIWYVLPVLIVELALIFTCSLTQIHVYAKSYHASYSTGMLGSRTPDKWTAHSRFKRKHDIEDLWYEIEAAGLKDDTVSAKITTEMTKLGPMKVRCSWKNEGGLQERFIAAFIEFKLPANKGFHREYKRIVSMQRDGTILWSNRPEWEHVYNGTRDAGTGTVHLKSAHLDLYATNMSCATQQGFYRCSVAIMRRPGNKVRYYQAHKKWMDIPCMHEYGRLKSKIAWGEGGSDSENLEQFLFEMTEVSGDVLAKSSTQNLVILAHRKYHYHYQGKRKRFDVLECRPSPGLVERSTYILGFVIELERKGTDFYVPIVGINDRGITVWSDVTYWKQTYLCGPKQRCPMGFGSVVDDPHMVLYIDECEKNIGEYKCHVYVQLAGSPASEATQSVFSVTENTCQQEKISTNVEDKSKEKELNFVELTTVASSAVELDGKKDHTSLIVGVTCTLVSLLIVGYLGYKTQSKIKQKREEEQRLIQMHNEKAAN